MNDFERLSRMANRIKAEYPEGTRILLIKMGDDDPRPIPQNTRGTVKFVDDMGTVHCSFDNGRNLGLVRGADRFRKLTEQELEEEALERRSKIVGISTSLTTDSGYGCFEGYTTSNKWNGWQCPLFNKENADKICKAYNNEFCQMRYDEENDCYIADYPVDEYSEKYEGRDYVVNGKVEHLYAIGSHEWCWAMAEQEEIEDENNAICVEESTEEQLADAGPTMSM